MLSLDATTRAEYDAATSADARAQAVLTALGSTVAVVVYDGSNNVMGSGTMQGALGTRSANVLTIGEVANFTVSSTGTPSASTWYIRFEGAGRWMRGSFGAGGDFTWSLSTWEAGQLGTIGTATATVPSSTVQVDLAATFSVGAGGTIVFAWNVADGYAINVTAGVGNAPLSPYLNVPSGITPTYTMFSGPSGMSVGLNDGNLAASAAVTPGVYTVIVDADDGQVPFTWTVSNYAISAQQGGTVPLAGYLQKPANVTPTYTKLFGAAGITVDSTTGVLSVAANVAAATYPVVVEADDNTDWSARSSGAAVIWAHDFTYQAEVDAFLKTTADRREGIYPTRVVDAEAGPCIELLAYGARLAADFPSNSTTLTVDDGSEWPNSGFYLTIGPLGDAFRLSGVTREMVLVTGRVSTNVFTVTRAVAYDASYSSTAKNWLTGDSVGGETLTWMRPFSAFTSPSNGLPADDRGGSGQYAVTKRAWPGQTFDSGYWGGGYYGHATYQAAQPNFRTITGAWDGDEFWLQFRVKIDPRFWQYHKPALYGMATDSSVWTHKMMFIQNVISTSQQICPQLFNPNRYTVNTSPYHHFTNFGASGPMTGANGSVQAGSDVSTYSTTCTLGSSTSGVAGNCWEWPTTATWVTLMYRIRPGTEGSANTLIEVKAWQAGQTGWATLYNVASNVITFENTAQTMRGYNAVMLAQYLNAILGYQAIPVKNHYKRFTQIIFSRAAIPCPTT